MDILYIVVPCYNEEKVLPETAKRLGAKLRGLVGSGFVSGKSRVLFVNDGSRDGTWEIIKKLHEEDSIYSGACLSRNRGHQNALYAGLMTACEFADITISIDADLQDDINAIDKMLEKYREGCDIVYGVRSGREKDSFFKKFTAEGFYNVIKRLGGEVVFNHADYRLMSRRALEAFAQYGEVNLFLRGIVPMLGFKTGTAEYERGERFAGESKYPLQKMLALAWEGITSLSSRPLRFISWLGALSLLASFTLLVVFIIGTFHGREIFGWRILLFAATLMGGLILTALGIVAEYVGKIYLETKKRPKYHIETVLNR